MKADSIRGSRGFSRPREGAFCWKHPRFATARSGLRFVAVLWVTLLAAVVHATVTDLAAVFHHFELVPPAPDDRIVMMLFIGLKESTRPAALGGVFLTLVPLCVAVGVYREAGS